MLNAATDALAARRKWRRERADGFWFINIVNRCRSQV
jgi:hypothetical protein